jgi:hypothetical protein
MQFKSDFLEFRAARSRNREVFLANYPELIKSIPGLLRNFDTLVEVVGSRFADDGNSHAGLIPFLRLAQRQAQSALDSATSFQAYEGWLLVRPAVEAVLILGKWLDDPRLAQVWNRRLEDPKSYASEYQGVRLRSKSLPRSAAIQMVLKLINDCFAHPNPSYVLRHSSILPFDPKNALLAFGYFDEGYVAEAGCIAMLHLLLVVQEEIRASLSAKFGELHQLDIGLASFEERFAARVKELVDISPEHLWTLRELGLFAA